MHTIESMHFFYFHKFSYVIPSNGENKLHMIIKIQFSCEYTFFFVPLQTNRCKIGRKYNC